jgi:hypothetical protein
MKWDVIKIDLFKIENFQFIWHGLRFIPCMYEKEQKKKNIEVCIFASLSFLFGKAFDVSN